MHAQSTWACNRCYTFQKLLPLTRHIVCPAQDKPKSGASSVQHRTEELPRDAACDAPSGKNDVDAGPLGEKDVGDLLSRDWKTCTRCNFLACSLYGSRSQIPCSMREHMYDHRAHTSRELQRLDCQLELGQGTLKRCTAVEPERCVGRMHLSARPRPLPAADDIAIASTSRKFEKSCCALYSTFHAVASSTTVVQCKGCQCTA